MMWSQGDVIMILHFLANSAFLVQKFNVAESLLLHNIFFPISQYVGGRLPMY